MTKVYDIRWCTYQLLSCQICKLKVLLHMFADSGNQNWEIDNFIDTCNSKASSSIKHRSFSHDLYCIENSTIYPLNLQFFLKPHKSTSKKYSNKCRYLSSLPLEKNIGKEVPYYFMIKSKWLNFRKQQITQSSN